jgi:hypothetical protein
MKKINCWEFKKCGREPGGTRTDLGICAASVEHRLHGVHGGKHAGRACWVVAGTLCGGKEQGTFAAKYHNCEKCDFYLSVRSDEGMSYKLSITLLQKLKETAPVFAPRETAGRTMQTVSSRGE